MVKFLAAITAAPQGVTAKLAALAGEIRGPKAALGAVLCQIDSFSRANGREREPEEPG
jgi:hypothetical protein